MASYVLFRDKNGFLLTDGKHRIFSSSIDLLVGALNQHYTYGQVYGFIEVPSSFEDDRIPLSDSEREKFLTAYSTNLTN